MIEFKAGYYEWNIYLDGELFYTFVDSGNQLGDDMWSIEHPEEYEEDYRYNSLEELVEAYIDDMQDFLREEDKQPLEEKYVPELKIKMIKAWRNHFGIEK